MTALRRKTLCDLSQEGTRTVLVVFAIALGIAGFLAVLSAYAVLSREMNREYLATNPASATLRMDKVDDQLIAAVLANGAVRDAEARRIVTGRIRAGRVKAGRGEWHDLRLSWRKISLVSASASWSSGRARGHWRPAKC